MGLLRIHIYRNHTERVQCLCMELACSMSDQ